MHLENRRKTEDFNLIPTLTPYSKQSLYACIDKCFDVRVSEDLKIKSKINLFIISQVYTYK